jgi:adenine-specific DNA-methyltransferase
MALHPVQEARRLTLQNQLDAAKTLAERNKLGQFPTPTLLATQILEYARRLLPSTARIRFLDPAFGTGSFYSALLKSFTSQRIATAVGYEIDPHYGQATVDLWRGQALDLRLMDFTRATPPSSDADRFNLLICNPPYVRHHHLTPAVKAHLLQAVQRTTGLTLNGLTGLYGYFLCLAHAWLAADGLAGWLIPSEFMDVNYGQPLKTYLLDQVTLLRIHRFDPLDVQFQDALVSSAVVWFKKTPPPTKHTVEFTYGGTLAQPALTKNIPTEALRETVKWTKYPHAPFVPPDQSSVKLADLFKIQRGLATGANDFFILSRDQITAHDLPRECFIPILPSPRFLEVDEITADDRGEPVIERSRFLLNCNLPEDALKRRYPTLWAYLQTGVAAGIDQGYLCQHRTPWYAQEMRAPAPFLCTYMGRQGTGRGRPFRFILNHSQATAPNVYLLLYPNPDLASHLKDHPHRLKAVWHALNDIQLETLIGEGRVYGGGLHKLEPNELANAPADQILTALPEFAARQIGQLQLFEKKESYKIRQTSKAKRRG